MPRVQAIVLPILRARFSDWEESQVQSWAPNVDLRVFPFINIRRIGGYRHDTRPTQLSLPVIEMTAYTQLPAGDLPSTETLYDDALEALYAAQAAQTQTPAGYIHSIKETMGATQFSSPYQDSFRVQGLIQLGIRPPQTP